MLQKTRGIILHSYNYSDQYSIVQVYTENFGHVSYLLSKSKGKKNRISRSAFHPLSVLDLDVEHFNLREIHRIQEAKIIEPMPNLLFDPVKSAIGLFLAEFIIKVIKEVHANPLLFDFIFQSIRILNLTEKGVANFHLVFMIRLCQFLGFYPDADNYRKGMFFDMQGGVFVSYKPFHPYFLNPDDSFTFSLLLRMDYKNMSAFQFSGKDRVDIIHKILEYYRLHLTDFQEINSLKILQEVFE